MFREEQTSNSLTLSEKKRNITIYSGRKTEWTYLRHLFLSRLLTIQGHDSRGYCPHGKKKKEPLQKDDDDVCLEFCCQPNNIALLTFQWVFVHAFRWEIIMQIAALTKLSTSQRSAQFPICGKTEIFMLFLFFFFFLVTDHGRGGNTLIGSAVRSDPARRHNAGSIWWKFWLRSLFCGVCETFEVCHRVQRDGGDDHSGSVLLRFNLELIITDQTPPPVLIASSHDSIIAHSSCPSYCAAR